jgi:hypothetical protein
LENTYPFLPARYYRDTTRKRKIHSPAIKLIFLKLVPTHLRLQPTWLDGSAGTLVSASFKYSATLFIQARSPSSLDHI